MTSVPRILSREELELVRDTQGAVVGVTCGGGGAPTIWEQDIVHTALALTAVAEAAKKVVNQIICMGGRHEDCNPCQNRDALAEALAALKAVNSSAEPDAALTDCLIAHYPTAIQDGRTNEQAAVVAITELSRIVKLQAAALEVWKAGKATKPA